ncbi:hypothetical protein [Peptostreptococcus anaerobius]|uniref:hypothetical protein n=1 Tax=Peptostreptococcus anaerobius TaxID=1261 RepID=UPI00321B1A50
MMKKAYIFLIFSIVLCAFAGGMLAGMGFTKYDIHTYAGTVGEKEYLPEEVKEDPEAKTIEKYDEQYLVKVKDHAGDIVVMNVTKEEFNQIDIGEKLKR